MKNFLIISLSLLFYSISSKGQFPVPGSIDFNSSAFSSGLGANSTVSSIVVQTDGKILIGGYFTTYNGVSRNYIARLNTDGSIDNSFNPGSGANCLINAIALQSDGKIIIGGCFTSYNGTSRNRIARLNVDGSLDTSFNPGNGTNAYVKTIAIQTDGKILIGGGFSEYNLVARNNIARLNSDGSLDTSFNKVFLSTSVQSIVIQPDRKILIGGEMYSGIQRLNQDGSHDASFLSSIIGGTDFEVSTVYAIAIQPDGKIIAGGDFFQDYGNPNNIIRLNPNGTTDESFNSGSGVDSYAVRSIKILIDGKILIGGEFYSYNNIDRVGLAQLNQDGSLNESYNSGFSTSGIVNAITTQPDGRVLIGGTFNLYDAVSVNNIARLNIDGHIDSGLRIGTGLSGNVKALAIQSDGKIIVAGSFTTFNGITRNRIVRLLSNGAIDNSFNPGTGANGEINAVGLVGDKIIIAGDFTTFNGVSRNRVAGLNQDGSLYTTFNVGAGCNNVVNAITVDSDGGIYLAGKFTQYRGVATKPVVKIFIDGSIDSNFTPQLNFINTIISASDQYLSAIKVKPDGKILIGGYFNIENNMRGNVALLNSDGTLNQDFNYPVTSNWHVSSVGFTNSGLTVIGGTMYGGIEFLDQTGQNSFYAAGTGANGDVKAMVFQPDGKILIAGTFTQFNGIIRHRIARLNANGTLDSSFNPNPGANATINAIAAQSDGNFIVGGEFTSYSGIGASRIARVIGGKVFQLLTFPEITPKTFGDPAFIPASTSSGLAITYTSSNTTVANVSGGNITVTGVGSAVISAAQAGNSDYHPAIGEARLVTVNKANQTITFNTLPVKQHGDAPFTLNASTTSGLPITYSSSAPSIATIAGNTVSILGNGTTVITASQAGNVNFNAATSVQQTLTILASQPSSQPTSLQFSSIATASMNVSFTAATGSPTGYLVLRKAGAPPSEVPIDANQYAGTFGASTVVYNGSSTSFTSSGLTVGTQYFYTIFAYNGSGQFINYLTLNPLSANKFTLPATPTLSLSDPTTSNFTATWTPVASAIHYELEVSLSDGFESVNLVPEYNPKVITSGNVIGVNGLQQNTQYYCRIRAINESGSSTNSEIQIITTQTSQVGTPLTISQINFNSFLANGVTTTPVTVEIAGGNGNKNVEILQRAITATAFGAPVVPTSTSGNIYTFNLPVAGADELGIEFFVRAHDASTTTNSTSRFIYRSINPNTVIPGLSFGGKPENYRIISIPYKLDQSGVSDIFPPSWIGDNTKMRLIRYVGAAYDDVKSGNLTIGLGYWFNAREKTTITLGEGNVSQNNQSNPFILNLQQGWNMIATPYPFSIDWSDIVDANAVAPVDQVYYTFNPNINNYDDDNNSLKPYEGGFVFAANATTLEIPVTLKNTAGGRKRAVNDFQSDIDADNWLVPLKLKQGTIENTRSAIGMHPDANLSKDKYDRIALPGFLEYVELTSNHDEFFAPYFSRDIVPQQGSYMWTLNFEASRNEPVEISWDNSGMKGSKAQLLLYDPVGGVLTDMGKSNKYLLPNGTRRELQVIYSRKGFENLIGDLNRPYPNPFKEHVNLPAYFNAQGNSTTIEIKILNMAGEEVYHQHLQTEQQGLIQPEWWGVNLKHESVSAGLYIYKIIYRTRSGAISSQGKIIKL
ncbi:MAG: hypothetical protein KF856_18375 [Cyclobacteriaceae bacterium]|nr:hypothetical protein [Cyclobacteriaceae bacterium]